MTKEEAHERIQQAQAENAVTLDLSRSELHELPKEIGALKNLRQLNLYDNILTELPSEIGLLSNLTHLALGYNRLRALPAEVGQLTSLRTLTLEVNKLQGLPIEISELRDLEQLNLYYNKIPELPPDIGRLNNLSELRLTQNQLSQLPAGIGKLDKLRRLDLSSNRLTAIPSEIGGLRNLDFLSLSGNKISSLPAEIGQLAHLTELWLVATEVLATLPSEIGKLTRLQKLHLMDSGLTSLPPEIGLLGDLRILHLIRCKLSSLPAEIGQLHNLTALHLSNCQLTDLPEEIGQLQNLQILDVTDNQFTRVPKGIQALPTEVSVKLDGNPVLARLREPTDEPTKVIFTIMPFAESPTRNKEELTAFFENEIKQPIESGEFKHRYTVKRSDDEFDITEQIIVDLFHADMVICDLSGLQANPNVMYELGIRLAFSDSPVILIREAHVDNHTIFDISDFYTERYDPRDYSSLRVHLRDKIKKLEEGKQVYHSPVLKIIGEEVPLLRQMSANRAAKILATLHSAMQRTLSFFGGAVTTFLGQQDPPVRVGTTNVYQLLDEIRAKPETLENTDWKPFDYSPTSQPTLEFYLAQRYLLGLIDDDIEGLLTEFLGLHHGKFFAGNHVTARWTPQFVYEFFEDTAIIVNAVDAAACILRRDSSVLVGEAKDHIRSMLKKRFEEEARIRGSHRKQ